MKINKRLVLILPILGLAAAACGSAAAAPSSQPSHSSAPKPSPSHTVTYTAAQAKFIDDLNNVANGLDYSQQSNATDLSLGNSLCKSIGQGESVAQIVKAAGKSYTAFAKAVTPLAVHDLCPQFDSKLVPPKPPPPPPHMISQTDNIVFSVQGSGVPSIQYGTDSITNNPGSAGPLSDGNYLPWSATMPPQATAQYYYVSAQLEGSGSITDSINEVITTNCSGRPPKTESFPLANGSASGGYAIADAQYNGGGETGSAQQAESDAGC